MIQEFYKFKLFGHIIAKNINNLPLTGSMLNEILSFINLGLVSLVIYGLIRFYGIYLESLQHEDTNPLDQIPEIVDTAIDNGVELIMKKEQVVKLVNFVNSFSGEVDPIEFVHGMINEAITEGLTGLMNEANIEEFQRFMIQIIESSFSQNPMLGALFDKTELTQEDMDSASHNANASIINIISSVNPLMPEILSRALGEDWQETAMNNPQSLMLILSKLKNMGVFEWIDSFTGNLIGGQSPTIKKSLTSNQGTGYR